MHVCKHTNVCVHMRVLCLFINTFTRIHRDVAGWHFLPPAHLFLGPLHLRGGRSLAGTLVVRSFSSSVRACPHQHQGRLLVFETRCSQELPNMPPSENGQGSRNDTEPWLSIGNLGAPWSSLCPRWPGHCEGSSRREQSRWPGEGEKGGPRQTEPWAPTCSRLRGHRRAARRDNWCFVPSSGFLCYYDW